MASSSSPFDVEEEINRTLAPGCCPRQDRHSLLTDMAPLQHQRISLSEHAKMRSHQRSIAVDAIQAVVDNAKFEPSYDHEQLAWLGSFAGISVVLDASKDVVLTAWAESAYGIDIQKKTITPAMMAEHQKAVCKLRVQSTWTSHTVAVVDQSGSMRKVDTDTQVMRSDMVWLNLAVTVVAEGLTNGTRSSTDVLSVVSMRKKGDVVISCQPFDWILFNKLVDLLRTSKPSHGGWYVPALDEAEHLLGMNRFRGCAASLLFLSDGRPSDEQRAGDGGGYARLMTEYCTERIGRIASLFGKRLTLCFVSVGNSQNYDFQVIEKMVDEAKQYSCPCTYRSECLSPTVLATAFQTMTRSTTDTITSISNAATEFGEREYRRFVLKPQRDVGKGDFVDENWTELPFRRTSEGRTIVKTRWTRNGWWSFPSRGIFHDPAAKGVAFENRWFGEGAERLVREFREIDAKGNFVGPKLVAKASLFLTKEENGGDPKQFHSVFCRTQGTASSFARKFNKRLLSVIGSNRGDIMVPLLKFVECSEYMLQTDTGRHGYLVEPMLDIAFEYRKFNDNVGGVRRNGSFEKAPKAAVIPGAPTRPLSSVHHLACITEEEEEDGEEEEEEEHDESSGSDDGYSSDEEEDIMPTPLQLPKRATNYRSYMSETSFKVKNNPRTLSTLCSNQDWRSNTDTSFDVDDIPQAFSCFTYHISRRKLLVCDLQGILNTSKEPYVYELTDPVIHRSTGKNRKRNKRAAKFGRTDRGQDGITDFFKTHKCSNLCRMLQKRQVRIDVNRFGDDIGVSPRRRQSPYPLRPIGVQSKERNS